jgi:4-alpha-glucanotransferase
MRSRSSGLLLHPTSLPGPWGIGDLGQPAFDFVDFLESAGQGVWQVLPLGPTGHGNSPYQSLCSLAGNPLLVSLDLLIRDGWLDERNLPPTRFGHPKHEGRVDYAAVARFKRSCLKRAFRQLARQPEERKADFRRFCEEERDWLDDFSTFIALKEHHHGASWREWEPGARRRDAAALATWQTRLSQRIEAHKFIQYLFFQQWRRLRRYANDRGVMIVGDMPIFVAFEGAEVWARPDLFLLDDSFAPTAVAGVPPDYFSATGQLWGNPIYRWERMAEDGYQWWIRRVAKTLELVDLVRLDHFRGFEAYWEVPAGEKTAINGRWVKGPGETLLAALQQKFGHLPFIAEDLGVITPEVERLRDQFGQPGMKVLHFAFGDTAANPYLPHNHVSNSIVYTGTHDNDTTLAWFAALTPTERKVIESYLGHPIQDICWDLIHLAFSSVADTAIVPVQDLLCLGSEARMNTPGQPQGCWEWRVKGDALTSDLARRLRRTSALFGRVDDARGDLKQLLKD